MHEMANTSEQLASDSRQDSTGSVVSIAAARETAILVRTAENEVATIISRQSQVAERMSDLQAKAEEVMHQLVVAQQEEQKAMVSIQEIINREDLAKREVDQAVDLLNRVTALLHKKQNTHETILVERKATETSIAPISIKVCSMRAEQNRFTLLAQIESARHKTELAHQEEQLLLHQVALKDAQLGILRDPSTEMCWYEVKEALGE